MSIRKYRPFLGLKEKESDYEKLNILGRYRSTNYDYLCKCDLHCIVGRICDRITSESGMASCTLELGARTPNGSKNYHLDDFSTNNGRVMDMGIFMACFWANDGIYRYRCMDSCSSGEFVSSIPVI